LQKNIVLNIVDYDTITRDRAKIIQGVLYLLDQIELLNNYSYEIQPIKLETNNSTKKEPISDLQSQSAELDIKIQELRRKFASKGSQNDKLKIKEQIEILQITKQRIDNKLKIN